MNKSRLGTRDLISLVLMPLVNIFISGLCALMGAFFGKNIVYRHLMNSACGGDGEK